MLVSVDYKPVPRTNIDGQVRDIVRSINWVRNNISRYGGDKRKIVIMGHSAGSHLVALIAAKRLGGKLSGVISNDVQAYDMVAYGGMRGSLPYVYAAAFGSNPKNWIKWSPVTYIRKGPRGGLPPHMIMYSGSNYARRKVLANGFGADLRAKGARVTLFDGRRYTHGSIARGIGTSAEVTRSVERFLRKAYRLNILHKRQNVKLVANRLLTYAVIKYSMWESVYGLHRNRNCMAIAAYAVVIYNGLVKAGKWFVKLEWYRCATQTPRRSHPELARNSKGLCLT